MTDEIAALRKRVAGVENWWRAQREAELEADIAALKADVERRRADQGTPEPSGPAEPTFYADELSDPTFWARNKDDIQRAVRDGRIRDRPEAPEPPARPAPAVPNGSADGGVRGQAVLGQITTSRIADPAFYRTHRAEIAAAIRSGTVVDDSN